MSRRRSYRNVGRRKSKVFDIDITSLLDILVILLVFLLKTYNSTGLIMNVSKEIQLPRSDSKTVNDTGIVVQVSPTTIWVDDKVILSINELPPRTYDRGGRRIIPLFDELVKKKNVIKQVEKSSPNAKKFSGIVNLVVDKSLKFSYVKKLLYTIAEAGFKEYKFVVLGEES